MYLKHVEVMYKKNYAYWKNVLGQHRDQIGGDIKRSKYVVPISCQYREWKFRIFNLRRKILQLTE